MMCENISKIKLMFGVLSCPFVFQPQLPRSTLPTFLSGIHRSCHFTHFEIGIVHLSDVFIVTMIVLLTVTTEMRIFLRICYVIENFYLYAHPSYAFSHFQTHSHTQVDISTNAR